MSELDNTEIVKRAYAAFKSGDIQALLALFTDDFEFQHPMPRSIWPFAGRRKGRAAFVEFIEGSRQVIEREHFEGNQFIAQGDFVVVLLSERIRAKATGISLDNPHVHVFKIVGGKIAHFMVFEDTAPIIAALQGSRK
ncbi:MAG: nuclear transport factor 2 family protein [Candidatus Binataceae bacterium]